MKIDKNSYGTIALAWLFSALFIFVFLEFIGGILAYILTGLFVSFGIFVTWFHRVPVRHTPEGEKLVTSGADGKVVIIKKTFEKEYLQRECIQVSVYMDFFNVHANFWPASGKITYYRYHPGKFLLAFLPKSAEENEHASTAIDTGHGEVFFKQIAGTFARRIVSYSEIDSQEVRGTQCGIIKFGSRLDIFLPLDADVKVKLGDTTRAAETIIAELK